MTNEKRINFDPRVWGPKQWFVLETIVRSLPSKLDKKTQEIVKNYFIYTANLTPCEICSKHMLEYIDLTNFVKMDINNKEIIIKWLNDLHNLRRGNNTKTIKEVDEYYEIQYDRYNTNYVDLLVIVSVIMIISLLLKYLLK